MNEPARPASAEGLSIVPAVEDQLEQIVDCHLAAFPDDLSSILGRRYVRGLYRFFIRRDDGICLAACDPAERVLGVVIGGEKTLRERYLSRSAPLVAWLLLCRLFTSGYVWWRIGAAIKSIFGRGARKSEASTALAGGEAAPCGQQGNWARLRIICVHPRAAGQGVGKALMREFADECRRCGYAAARLRVSSDNERAVALYEKSGWRRVGQDGMFIHYQLEFDRLGRPGAQPPGSGGPF